LLSASAESLNISTLSPANSKILLNSEVISGSSSTNKIFFFLLSDDDNRDVTDRLYLDYIVYYDLATISDNDRQQTFNFYIITEKGNNQI
jgi:hypothetical protein